MRGHLKKFVKEEEGATMVEYGLMVALIAITCILVITAMGREIGSTFDKTQKEISATPPQVQVTP